MSGSYANVPSFILGGEYGGEGRLSGFQHAEACPKPPSTAQEPSASSTFPPRIHTVAPWRDAGDMSLPSHEWKLRARAKLQFWGGERGGGGA